MTSKWKVIKKGGSSGDFILYNDYVYLQSVYSGGYSYLDTCGGSGCSNAGQWNVNTNTNRDRDSGSGTWQIILSEKAVLSPSPPSPSPPPPPSPPPSYIAYSSCVFSFSTVRGDGNGDQPATYVELSEIVLYGQNNQKIFIFPYSPNDDDYHAFKDPPDLESYCRSLDLKNLRDGDLYTYSNCNPSGYTSTAKLYFNLNGGPIGVKYYELYVFTGSPLDSRKGQAEASEPTGWSLQCSTSKGYKGGPGWQTVDQQSNVHTERSNHPMRIGTHPFYIKNCMQESC